ncbi:MAG TPA: peptidylprolyl isomerase [Mycobacteriales bacterium]|nr:peptidylprolyl isomerase [Mycobacteriales bacterium]
MRTGRALSLALVALAAAAGCASSSSGGNAQVSPATGAPSGTATNANGCTPPPALQKTPQSYKSEPKLKIARTTYTATIVTNCGTITVKLDGKHAPHTVNSFAFLAGKGYFDDTPCHRLTDWGVLQCGDPTGTGGGGPGYTLPDENLKGATYGPGVLAMANTGRPHTGGSQFFFCYEDTGLPAQYTPFGKITKGLDILTRVAAAGSNPPQDGAPVQPVVIESFTVTKG